MSSVFLSFWLLSQDGKKNLVLHSDSRVCLFLCVEVLRPSQPIRAMLKFNQLHVFLGRLRPLGISQLFEHILLPETDKGENDRRKYFMINLHLRMLPDLAGIKSLTS